MVHNSFMDQTLIDEQSYVKTYPEIERSDDSSYSLEENSYL
jgi:hypothetical protein